MSKSAERGFKRAGLGRCSVIGIESIFGGSNAAVAAILVEVVISCMGAVFVFECVCRE